MSNGLLTKYPDLRALQEQRLQQAVLENPHLETNPVRTIEDWCVYVERFAHLMPWQTMDIGEDHSFFRRIDQNIGYFYFLLGDLQYEPRVAQWLKQYNTAWGEWLSSPESWNDDYYQLALSDPLFELATDRYESPDNWHSWNDFFTRKLRKPFNFQLSTFNFISPCDGAITSAPVKTASIENWLDLLGDSAYRESFAGGETMHIVLDVFDYHRFHMPCDGTVLECNTIQGIHAGGGNIIWDEEQGRYRYEQCGVTDFQMLETRGVLIIDTPAYGKIAIVPVGVQQVSSVQWTHPILKSQISNFLSQGNDYFKFQIPIRQGEELGCFLFGGSDVVLFFEPGRAPHVTPKSVKVGEKIA